MAEKFKVPSPSEVFEYGVSIGYRINGEKFCAFYESKGWMVGKSPMKSWKACVKTWKIHAQENEGGGIFKAVPKESDADRIKRLLAAYKCPTCYDGKLDKTEDEKWRCRSCNGDYTKAILKQKGRTIG